MPLLKWAHPINSCNILLCKIRFGLGKNKIPLDMITLKQSLNSNKQFYGQDKLHQLMSDENYKNFYGMIQVTLK